MKKILALVLALTMLLMVGAVFADEGDSGAEEPAASTYSGSVTVSGLANKDEATFYQIIRWVGEAEGNVKGWAAVDTYASVLTTAKLTEVLLGTAQGTTPETYKNPTGITPELAGELADLAPAGVDPFEVGTDGKATLDITAPGTFMVLVKAADVNTVYNPIFVSATYDNNENEQAADNYGDSTVKKSTLTLDKTASTSEDAWDDKKPTTTAIGDTVSFKVEATIPAYSKVYDSPYFAIKDSLTDLKLDAGTVTVTGLTKDEDYSVTEAEDGSNYTVTFSTNYLKSLKQATTVTVKYSAKVTSSAGYAINEEKNEVMVLYSHDPTNESDYDVKKDSTQHYTFTIDAEIAGKGSKLSGKKTSEIVKIGVDANGQPITSETIKSWITDEESWSGPLEGAVFGLFTDSECKNAYIPKKVDGTSTEKALTATTGKDGRMSFAGLDAGTYYIKEISAPAGYVTNSTPVEVKISATTKEINVTEWWNGTEWVSEKPTSGTAKEYTYKTEVLESYKVTVDGNKVVGSYTFDPKDATNNEIQWETVTPEEHPYPFTNIKGVELPSTGGIGTTIFYILGGLLVVGAVVILVARRKAQD